MLSQAIIKHHTEEKVKPTAEMNLYPSRKRKETSQKGGLSHRGKRDRIILRPVF